MISMYDINSINFTWWWSDHTFSMFKITSSSGVKFSGIASVLNCPQAKQLIKIGTLKDIFWLSFKLSNRIRENGLGWLVLQGLIWGERELENFFKLGWRPSPSFDFIRGRWESPSWIIKICFNMPEKLAPLIKETDSFYGMKKVISSALPFTPKI